MTTDVSSAIETILGRMETNPSEFFDSAYKWRFVFKELFLDVLTDAEKTALNDGMTRVRRAEFSSMVLRAILDEPIETGTVTTMAGTTVNSQYNPTIQNQQSATTASQYNTAQYHAAQQRIILNNAGMGVAQQASHLPLQNAMAGQGQNMYGLANSNGIK